MSLNEERQNFINRFGPKQLSKYQGKDLLKLLAAPKNEANSDLKQLFGEDFTAGFSSMYQALEEETKSWGRMSGNMTATREVFYQQKEKTWKHYKKSISPEEAIQEAERTKKYLIQAADFLEHKQFKKFYEYANTYKQFFSKGFIHKYLYICFPEWIILNWHKTGYDADAFYKQKLGIKSKELFSLENYFYQKNPGRDFTGIKEQLEKEFGNYNPAKAQVAVLHDILLEFIRQSRVCWRNGSINGSIKTKGEYRSTVFKCSYGSGRVANTTFCSFLAYRQKTQCGIYPVILFNKNTQKLEVCYGVSINNTSKNVWPDNRTKGLPHSSSDNYTSSFVFQSFIIPDTTEDIEKELPAIIESADHVITDFHQVFEGFKGTNIKDTNKRNFPLNQILYGPPGTGKTYHTVTKAVEIIDGKVNPDYSLAKARFDELKKEGKIKFITFHQNYSYEDFMVGIRPMLNGEKIAYKLYEGPFKQIADKAQKDTGSNYVLIIDEINRGNISKIFGELITLIEDDKRAGNDHAMSAPLLYQQEEFSVPNNLHIIGTMNTADKSIALVDIALRRRFVFEEMMPDESLLKPIEGFDLPGWFKRLNEKITAELDRDHQIGHSNFMKVTNKAELKQKFYQCILPLLQEYFYGNPEKLKKIIPGFEQKDQLKNDEFIKALENILHDKTDNNPGMEED